MTSYRKVYVDDTAVLLVDKGKNLFGLPTHRFGVRVSGVPIGLAYREAGSSWCLLDFIPWDDVPLDWRADPDSVPFPQPQEEACPESTPVISQDA